MIRDRLRTDLRQAVTDRDMARARVLRNALAALENAEAVEGTDSSDGILGYGDVPRRTLTDDEMASIVTREIEELGSSALEYRRVGHPERAESLERGIEILRGYVS